MKQIFESLGVEFKEADRYTTKCPKCTECRKKQASKSLQVFKTEKGYSFKCFHSDQCEWNKPYYISDKGDVSILNIDEKEVKFIPFPSEDIELPIDKQNQKWVYRNEEGKPVLYIVRIDIANGSKLYHPFSFGDDGFIYMRRPKLKLLYRSEFLNKDERPVVVVEGEKAADAAAKIFTKADVVSWVGGANSISEGNWDLIKGRKIILWPDNDEPGKKAMYTLSELLDSNYIYIVNTSSLPEKADLADEIDIEVIKNLYKSATKIESDVITGEMVSSDLQKIHSKEIKYVPFGWEFMDKYVQLPPTGVVVVSGRTNHGKTAFMINTALNVALNTDKTVLYLSLEFPIEELNLRMVKTIDGNTTSNSGWEDDVYFNDTLRNLNTKAAQTYHDLLSSRKLRVVDSSASMKDIIKLMDKCKSLNKDLVLFIDYLQILPLESSGKARYEQLKNMIELFRFKANTNNQLLVGGSQLTAGESPLLDQVRESKDLENTAALHLRVWNKDKGKEKEISLYDNIQGSFVVHVEKSRQYGANGKSFGFNFTNGCKLIPAFNESKERGF